MIIYGLDGRPEPAAKSQCGGAVAVAYSRLETKTDGNEQENSSIISVSVFNYRK